jgi:hypothetical protein
MTSCHHQLVLSSTLRLLHCDITNFKVHRWRNRRLCASSSNSSDNGNSVVSSSTNTPWEITRYLTKKKGRPIDTHGNIIDSLDNTADWFALSSQANKIRFAANVLSRQLGNTSENLLENVANLGPILPGGVDSLKKMKPADVVRVASKIEDVPAKLIEIRQALPPCINVANLLSSWPDVLLLPINGEYSVKSGYKAVLDQFQSEIGEDAVHEMLKCTPQLLDSVILADVMRGAGHLMPLRQLASSLARYEDYWMQFQTLEKEPRNDYEDTLNDDVYYWKEDVVQRGKSI